MAMWCMILPALRLHACGALGMASKAGSASLSASAHAIGDLESLLLHDRSEMEELLSQHLPPHGCCYSLSLTPAPCCLSVRHIPRASCPSGGFSSGGAVGWRAAGCPATAEEAHMWIVADAAINSPQETRAVSLGQAWSNNSYCDPPCMVGRGVCAVRQGSSEAACFCKSPFSGSTCAEGGDLLDAGAMRDEMVFTFVRNFPESGPAFQSEVPLLSACLLWLVCICFTLAVTSSLGGGSQGGAPFKRPPADGTGALHADSPFFLDDCEEAWVREIPDPRRKTPVNSDRSWGRTAEVSWRGAW